MPGAAIPPPEEYLRPCPECGEVSAIYHAKCPACGAPLGAALPAREQDLPTGWDGDLLPDGTVRLQPNRFTRALRIALSLVPITIVVLMGFRAVEDLSWLAHGLSGMDSAIVQVINAALLLLCAALTAGLLLWAIFGEEEWQVGPDLVVIRRRLFRWGWKRTYTSGRLQVVTYYHSRGYSISLVLFQDGRQVTLARDGLGAGRVRSLGVFLSRVTGWPFQEGIRNWL